jgi:putative phosphoesterase
VKIGIVSDSHGKAHRLRAALDAMRERNVDAIVHCGDIGSQECMEMLAEAGVDVYAVSGNMDRHVDSLQQAAEAGGVHFSTEVIEVPLGEGKSLAATHGSDRRILGELIEDQQFPYVCHGHSHHFRDERCRNVRVINPGALVHPHRPRHPTVVILDTSADTLEVIEISR